jgi:hypothetical protein
MMRRSISRSVARWLVVALLFAQGAMVANACLAANSARVDAIVAATHEGCDMQERNVNLCLYHCADQYNGAAAQQVPLLAPAMVALAPPVWAEPMAPRVEAWTPAVRATGPPIPVRHCCFRI